MAQQIHCTISSIIKILVAIALMASTSSSVSAQPDGASAVELDEAYRWFDGLGYPNVSNLPFVEVQYPDDPENPSDGKPKKRFGFLVADSGSEFRVFYPDLTTFTYHLTPLSTSIANRVGYTKIDLLDWVFYRIVVFKSFDPWNTPHDNLSNLLEDTAQFFVLGRACAAHSRPDLARNLVNASLKSNGPPSKVPNSSLKAYLEAVMATASLSQAIKQVVKPNITRASMPSVLRDVARRFPDTEEGSKAAKILPVLARMAEEDRTHDPNIVRHLDELPLPKRIEELVFELRDEDGALGIMMGTDLFIGKRGEKSAANELVKIGLPAVPTLIKALESQNYTKCIPRYRRTSVARDIYTVGDFARAIIERIANRSFYKLDYLSAAGGKYSVVTDTVERADVKAKIEAWWSEINSKGEKAYLIAEVERGDSNSGQQAMWLRKRYSSDALPAIKVGLTHASDPETINNLLGALSTIKNSAVIPVFHTYVNSNADLSVRTGAALYLLDRGDLSPLPGMIQAWRQDKTPDSKYGLSPDDGLHWLIVYLRCVGKPAAIDALADGLDRRSDAVRAEVVDLLCSGELQYDLARSRNVLVKFEPGRLAKLNMAAERLFARELLDTEQRNNSVDTGHILLDNPRICEVAAAGLGNILPMKYAFKQSSSMLDLDAQRLAFYNIWLKSNGKPPLAALPPAKPSL